MSDRDELAGCLILLLAPVAGVTGWLFSGFVTMKLWAWFVVPALGVAAIGYPLALGIELAVASLVPAPHPPEDLDEARILWRTFTRSWVLPALLLLFGWLVTVIA